MADKNALVMTCDYCQEDNNMEKWLSGCVSDGEKVIKVLKTIFNYKEENIEFIHDRKGPLNDVSAKYFIERLDIMVQNSKPGDELFCFFSGHGTNPVGGDDARPESQSLVCSSAYLEDGGSVKAWQINRILDRLPIGVSLVLMVDACYAGDMIYRLKEQFDETINRGMPDALHSTPNFRRHLARDGVTFFPMSSKFQESFQYETTLKNGETRYSGLTSEFMYVVQENGGNVTNINLLKEVYNVVKRGDTTDVQNPTLFANDERCNMMFLRDGRWSWQFNVLRRARWVALAMFATSVFVGMMSI